MRFLVLLWLLVWAVSSVEAADFTCVSDPSLGALIKSNDWIGGSPWPPAFYWQGGSKPTCYQVAIEGKIIPGDADKLEWLLTEGSQPTRHFFLLSPGGNVMEAMTMGRLLRVRFASVVATFRATNLVLGGKKFGLCGSPDQPVCCASACALLYFGGAHWNRRDRLGLHRPTLEDLGGQDYSQARDALEKVGAFIQQYLREMEVDGSVFEAMMHAEPDQLAARIVGRNYPPSMQDWLTAKCKLKLQETNPTGRNMDSCMFFAFEEYSSEHKWTFKHYDESEAKQFTWYPEKSKEQLKRMADDYDSWRGPIRNAAISNEIAKREAAEGTKH